MNKTITKPKPKKSSGAVAFRGVNAGKIAARELASGVVDFCIHGRSSRMVGQIRKTGFTPSEMIEVIRGGLPVRELDVLQASLDVPMERLAPRLGISKATLHRRKLEGRLGREESDRLVRVG